MAKETAKPKRVKREFVAFEFLEEEDVFFIAARGFKDTAEARLWMRDKGEPGHHYVPGRLTGDIETVTAHVEPVETRKLVSYSRSPEEPSK